MLVFAIKALHCVKKNGLLILYIKEETKKIVDFSHKIFVKKQNNRYRLCYPSDKEKQIMSH